MREDYEIISAVVDSLRDECEVYVNYLYKENSITQAAEDERVSEEVIKSRFYRAKSFL